MLGVLGSTVGLVRLACIKEVALLVDDCSFLKRQGRMTLASATGNMLSGISVGDGIESP